MTKRADAIALLESGWVTTGELQSRFGWKSHTVRGFLSTLGSKEHLRVERQRVDGVTSYRIAPNEP